MTRTHLRRGMTAAAVFAVVGLAGHGSAAAVPITLEPFASGLSAPVSIAHAGDDRLFVVEKGGTIRIVQSDGTVLGTEFLDITSLVSTGGEQGLLGLAFHPDYDENGFFFVHYTDTAGDTVVARYSVTANPNVADPLSGLPIFTTDQPFSNHNGGALAFGPDGYLYISLGDGGAGCDPADNGQNLATPLGKILRIDVDSGSPYAIPPDNPFAGSMTAREEIWAWGLRNPWRISFDRLTGDLYIADVGQQHREEVNVEPAGSAGGLNYGWDCFEGNEPASISNCTTTATCSVTSMFTFPVHEYDHTGGRCSITGGYVYRGSASPAIAGHYFFADLCSAEIYDIVSPDNGETWNLTDHGALVPNLQPTTFGEDSSGELYLTGFNGTMYRIVAETPPAACPSAPATGCLQAGKSTLQLKRPGEPTRQKLIWKWLKGPAVEQADFGDPVTGATGYTLCIYAGTTQQIAAVIPASPAWRPVSTRGYKLTDKSASNDGIFKALLKGGTAGKSKVLVKGKGANLDLSAMPLGAAGGATVQLLRNDASECWESVFAPGDITRDDPEKFKAKAP